jgi:hypothetical protein
MKKPNKEKEKKKIDFFYKNYRKWNQKYKTRILKKYRKKKRKKKKRKREKGGNNPRKNQGNKKWTR